MLQEELERPEYSTDYAKLSEIQDDISQKEAEVEQLIEEWETLNE